VELSNPLLFLLLPFEGTPSPSEGSGATLWFFFPFPSLFPLKGKKGKGEGGQRSEGGSSLRRTFLPSRVLKGSYFCFLSLPTEGPETPFGFEELLSVLLLPKGKEAKEVMLR